MIRVVFLSTRPPEPLTNGSAIRINGFLSNVPDNVEVLRIYPESEADRLPPDVTFTTGKVSRIRELFSINPIIILKNMKSPSLKEVKKRIIEFDPDLVIASGIHVLPFVPPGYKVLYDAHNVEWHLCRGSLEYSCTTLIVRLHRLLTVWKLRRKENKLVKQVDQVFACSHIDCEYFSKLRGKAVPVIYNGIDIDYWSMEREPEPGLLLFPGDMSYLPNIDSAVFLVEEVLPKLKKLGFKGKLVLCGRDPDIKVRNLASADVEVTGTLDDIRSYYSRAEILLAPLRIGSGTPLKIVTGMVAGVPVISTSRVVKSMGLSDESMILQADTPDEFAEQIMKLWKNKPLADDISLKARHYAKKKYSWNSVGARFWNQVELFIDKNTK